MKVLDLQCGHFHVFEGWFASEDAFVAQRASGLVQCPVCGDAEIVKKLSSPRLNFGRGEAQASATQEKNEAVAGEEVMQSAWMAAARRILANTDDVGERFAEEARKMHYGEAKQRGIRGESSAAEVAALVDEGIDVLHLPLPASLKEPLQ